MKDHPGAYAPFHPRDAPTATSQRSHTVLAALHPKLAVMIVVTAARQPLDETTSGPVLDVVVPVHNEEAGLDTSVRRLHGYLDSSLPYSFRITIADNASTDGTLRAALALAAELPHIRVRHLPEKGRGRALRSVWTLSEAQVLAYMDVDLSTDLAALLPLVAPLVSGHSDLAVGTRLAHGSRVVRGLKREIISRGYNVLLHRTLSTRFSDAQCGFKAIRADVAARLLPLVEDTGWFFDTELLVLAERSGLRIHEVPVDWIDDSDSRVDIVATAVSDVRGIVRIGKALAARRLPVEALRTQLGRAPLAAAHDVPTGLVNQLIRFAAVGVVSTLAYVVLFLLLRGMSSAQAANLLALLLTAIGNTATNRHVTFGITGRSGLARHQAQGLVVFALGLGLTSGSLAVLHALTETPEWWVELSVLVIANLAATLLRFLLLRGWVFHDQLDDDARQPTERREAQAAAPSR